MLKKCKIQKADLKSVLFILTSKRSS